MITMVIALILNTVSAESNFIKRAQVVLAGSQEGFSTNRGFSSALNLARAAFDSAELETSAEQLKNVAQIGINAARAAISFQSDSAAAHYYLAVNIGQLARVKTFGALKLVNEMERALKRSIELDPKFQYAAATRALALLYLETPGWPLSIGNKKKARNLMEEALELAPSYPGAHLIYMEALQRWREPKLLRERIDTFEKLLPGARKEFAGEEWEDEWADWEKRWKSIQN